MKREERFYKYGGKEIVAMRYDPFGYIELEFADEDEELPNELKGQFNSFDAVYRALETYYNTDQGKSEALSGAVKTASYASSNQRLGFNKKGKTA